MGMGGSGEQGTGSSCRVFVSRQDGRRFTGERESKAASAAGGAVFRAGSLHTDHDGVQTGTVNRGYSPSQPVGTKYPEQGQSSHLTENGKNPD